LPGTSAIQAKVQAYLDANGMNGATATIDVCGNLTPGGGACECCDITSAGCQPCVSTSQRYSLVTVTVPYRIVSISMFSFMQVNLRGKAAMRNENNLQ